MTGPGDPRFSEDDLRAALRSSGTAGTPDPDALIGRARGIRARRRGAVAGAGVVAALILGSVGAQQSGVFDGSADGLRAGSRVEHGDTTHGQENHSAPAAPAPTGPGDRMLPFDSQSPGPSQSYLEREPISGTPCERERPDPGTPPTGPGSNGPLLDFAPTGGFACVYLVDGTAVATQLSAAQTAAAVAVLSAGEQLRGDLSCTSEFGPALRLIVEGDGRTGAIDAESYGCGVVSTPTASRMAKAQVQTLLALLDPRLRPLA